MEVENHVVAVLSVKTVCTEEETVGSLSYYRDGFLSRHLQKFAYSGVLCPALGSPAQGGHGPVRVAPE